MANISSLTTLLPSTPYILIYSLPLLFVSLLLTFAGAFLTLDRSRSFPPCALVPGAFQSAEKRIWLLEGGVGGLSLGYALGVHLSTFLSLLIPAVSPASPLTPKAFLAVWILSIIPTALFGGRWKYCALPFAGVSGGALIAISLSVIFHPSLPSRVVLTATIVPILTTVILLPFSRLQHASLRFAASFTGSFGVILSIALLSGVPGWANVWERLWLIDGVHWGTEKEKGLSTALCLFLCAGLVSDWVLKRKFGECPDQKWDYYLAKYASNLPHRAGTFQPLRSFWDRVFGSYKPAVSKGATDSSLKLDHPPLLSHNPSSPRQLRKEDSRNFLSLSNSEPSVFQKSPAFLKKGRSCSPAIFQARVGKRKNTVKFKPLGDVDSMYSSDSDKEVADMGPLPSTNGGGKVSPRSTQMVPPVRGTGANEVDNKQTGTHEDKNGDAEGRLFDYSDYEEDVTEKRDRNTWSPAFLSRHRSNAGAANPRKADDLPSPQSPTPGAVPATPSLIRALGRIAVAQQTAFGLPNSFTTGLPPSKQSESLLQTKQTGENYNGLKWDAFWRDVRVKAMV